MKYRIVYHTRPPVTGTRYPLGAVIQKDDGSLLTIKASRLPCKSCIGREGWLCMKVLLEGMDKFTSFNHLPMVFGPACTLDEVREIPKEVEDPAWWVRKVIE